MSENLVKSMNMICLYNSHEHRKCESNNHILKCFLCDSSKNDGKEFGWAWNCDKYDTKQFNNISLEKRLIFH